MSKKPEPRHQCLIYEGSPSLKLKLVAIILEQKLNEGYRCLYLNSAPMVAGMCSILASLGVDVVAKVAEKSLVLSSDQVAPGEDFDCDLMLDKLEDSLNQALDDGYKGLWASGDMTFEFGPRHDFSKLVEYEMKLEKMIHRRKEFCGICQYHRDTLPHDVVRQGLLVHPSIMINQTLTIINPYYLKSGCYSDHNQLIERIRY